MHTKKAPKQIWIKLKHQKLIKELQQGALEGPKDEWKELKTRQCIHTYKETTCLKQQNEK